MSEVKRYSLTLHKVKGKFESPEFERDNGEWVKFEDYARLKAEVERLTEARDYFIHKIILKNEQVDELTSAGDGLQDAFLKLTSGTSNWDGKLYWKWNAAKEGKPSV